MRDSSQSHAERVELGLQARERRSLLLAEESSGAAHSNDDAAAGAAALPQLRGANGDAILPSAGAFHREAHQPRLAQQGSVQHAALIAHSRHASDEHLHSVAYAYSCRILEFYA